MLHPLKALPRELESKLLALIDRQRDLLVFAVNTSSSTDLLCDNGRRNFTKAAEVLLRSSLTENFTDWLSLVEYTGVRVNLERLTQCPKAHKAAVLADFDHDQWFWLDDDPAFQFAFDPDKTTAHQAAKKCLTPFFERFFRFDLLLPDGAPFRKKEIYEGYVATNPTVATVCAFCDGSMKRDRPENQARDYTLEHFFHKETHPSISLHPYNLVPCCEVCNEERGNREALELNGQPLTLGEIFHPLIRPARANVELRYYSNGLEPEELEFIKIHPKDWQTGIEVYSHLYRIPARWKELWPDIGGVIDVQLRALISNHQFSQQTGITPIDFQKMVHSAISSLQSYSGRYEYPAHHWLLWAINDIRRIELLYQSQIVARGLQATEAV